MLLHGSLDANLLAALGSMQRLRGHPVHADTLAHWRELVAHARRSLNEVDDSETLQKLIAQLDGELADRVR